MKFSKPNCNPLKKLVPYQQSLPPLKSNIFSDPPDPPRILVDKEKQHLTCIADGNPSPTYEWTMPKGSTPPKKFGSTVQMDQPFDPSRQNDTYACTASNSAGRANSVNISVYEALHHSPSKLCDEHRYWIYYCSDDYPDIFGML